MELQLFVQVCKILRKYRERFPKKYNKFHEWFIEKKLMKQEYLSKEKILELLEVSMKRFKERTRRIIRRVIKKRNRKVLGFD